VAFPAEATPELLQQLEAEASKRELIARVKGKGDGTDAATAQFPAVWKVVEFEGRRGKRIQAGDCELLEQLVDAVLVPMGARVAPDSRLGCMPNHAPLGPVRLRLETLQKPPEPDASPS
jgi:hypothetical protein